MKLFSWKDKKENKNIVTININTDPPKRCHDPKGRRVDCETGKLLENQTE